MKVKKYWNPKSGRIEREKSKYVVRPQTSVTLLHETIEAGFSPINAEWANGRNKYKNSLIPTKAKSSRSVTPSSPNKTYSPTSRMAMGTNIPPNFILRILTCSSRISKAKTLKNSPHRLLSMSFSKMNCSWRLQGTSSRSMNPKFLNMDSFFKPNILKLIVSTNSSQQNIMMNLVPFSSKNL